jgi:hypothetical protein
MQPDYFYYYYKFWYFYLYYLLLLDEIKIENEVTLFCLIKLTLTKLNEIKNILMI